MINSAKPFAKYLQLKNVNIYDSIFNLHSKCTMVILLTIALLLSAKQYFGDPIYCMTDLKYADFVHSYCWTFSAFITATTAEDTRLSIGVGVGPNGIQRLTLRYYKWVVIVILLEALVFYLPSYLWKMWENNHLEQLCLPMISVVTPRNKIKDHCIQLSIYFNENNGIFHRNYMRKYFMCEILNLCISTCNIIFLEFFLNGFWSRYFQTISQVSLDIWDIWNYHTSQIFPKLAKCTISTFGLGGSINNNDALCMLPLNIVNEKVFVFLWFWFILIINLAVIKLIYDLVLILCLPLRIQLLRIAAKDISYYQMRYILLGRSIADWFILYKMSLNVNSVFFRDFLLELQNSKSLRNKFFDEL